MQEVWTDERLHFTRPRPPTHPLSPASNPGPGSTGRGWFTTLGALALNIMDASSQSYRRTLTAEQAAAVDAVGNVLLMAGAGTGKTSTLVARVVARAVEGAAAVPLDRILMVTFTEAAAAEMRHRLRETLASLAADAPEEERLADQLARLETAHIGTIHSFCLRLVREHFHELHLDPQLRVLEPAEAGQMFRETLDAVLEPLLQRLEACEE